MTGSRVHQPVSLEELPAKLVLEVDAICDDFERNWRRSRRRGTPPPEIDAFANRIPLEARMALVACLDELNRQLRLGMLLPEVPGFVLEEEIGRGGMGVVYRARRLEDGRVVALKLIPGAEHARWSRWLAELADLHHPNLVPLEAFGTHEGLHFVVMQLVTGGDLRERFAEFVVASDGQRDTHRAVAQLIAKVASAVDFLHQRGILHRDLKPSNILLAGCPEPEPLVCDFGLAGRTGETSLMPSIVGTPKYMAPEQMQGQPLTPAADLWSLGAVLHELLTGRAPFVDASGWLDIDRKRFSQPTALRALNPAVDDPLERICLRCLENDPLARYSTAAELVHYLRCYLDE